MKYKYNIIYDGGKCATGQHEGTLTQAITAILDMFGNNIDTLELWEMPDEKM